MFVQAQCMIRWPTTPWGWRPAEQWVGRGADSGLLFVARRDGGGDLCGAHIAPAGEVLPAVRLSVGLAAPELHGRASSIGGRVWWSGDGWCLYRVLPRGDSADGPAWVLHHGAQVPEGCMPHERSWTESGVGHWGGDEFWTLADSAFPAPGDAAVAMAPRGSARESGASASIRVDWSRVWTRSFSGSFANAAGVYADSSSANVGRPFGTPSWYSGSGAGRTSVRASLDPEEGTGRFSYVGAMLAGYDQARGVWRTAGAESWWQTASDPADSTGQAITFARYSGGQPTGETRTYAAEPGDGLSVAYPEQRGDAWLGRVALWR